MKHGQFVEFQLWMPGQVSLDKHRRFMELLSVSEGPPARGGLVKLPIREGQQRSLRFADWASSATAENHAEQNSEETVRHNGIPPNDQSSGTRDQPVRTAKRNWNGHPALPAAMC